MAWKVFLILLLLTGLARATGGLPEDGAGPGMSSVAKIPTAPGIAGAVDRYAIGCILPLTGKHAAYGKKAREAILLARALADPDGKSAIRFLFEDSQGKPDLAVAAVKKLVHQGGVIGILGPLGHAEVPAAASAAQKLGVPILTLTQKPGVTAIGNQVFRNALTPAMQAKALVKYAVTERDVRHFAVLYPDDPSGREMKESFEREVQRQGGTMAITRSYVKGQTDFRNEIRVLSRLPEAAEPDEAGAKRENHPLPPDIGFEALFLPDGAGTVSLVAAQLSYYNVTGVLLLGTSAWNNPELLKNDPEYLDGAVFVDDFYAQSFRPEVNEFTDRFYAAYGREPGGMDALVFDGAAILLKVLMESAPATRQKMRERLGELKDYPGVTGRTSFLSTRDAEKEIFVLIVQNGRVVQIR